MFDVCTRACVCACVCAIFHHFAIKSTNVFDISSTRSFSQLVHSKLGQCFARTWETLI